MNPLSPLTCYRRHRRRALTLIAFLSLAVVGPYLLAGLRLNFLNPAPWLFTLPVPAAVFAVGAGTMAWLFSRLDPVAIIERRS